MGVEEEGDCNCSLLRPMRDQRAKVEREMPVFQGLSKKEPPKWDSFTKEFLKRKDTPLIRSRPRWMSPHNSQQHAE